MEIPTTLLTVIEHGIVSVLLGTSTVAVLLYTVNLRYKDQWNDAAVTVTRLTYTTIRLFHVFFIVLVAFSLLIYGVLDGVAEARVEYGIKAVILAVNAVVAYGMYKKLFPIMYAAPITVAGWYFLAGYHVYTTYTVATVIITPFVWYLVVIAVLQGVFLTLRTCVKPRGNTF